MARHTRGAPATANPPQAYSVSTRMPRKPTLAEAMRVVAAADPAQKLRQEMHAAVRGENIIGQRATPAPSFAGQSPQNSALIVERQRVHEQNQQAEAAARERRAERLEEEIRTLQAGQAPDNVRLVRSTINQG